MLKLACWRMSARSPSERPLWRSKTFRWALERVFWLHCCFSFRHMDQMCIDPCDQPGKDEKLPAHHIYMERGEEGLAALFRFALLPKSSLRESECKCHGNTCISFIFRAPVRARSPIDKWPARNSDFQSRCNISRKTFTVLNKTET